MLNIWHSFLDMDVYDKQWHERDIADEAKELAEAEGFIHTWSELSDVAYTYTRAHWSGHEISQPLTPLQYCAGLVYMFPKYTLRWWFFRRAGKQLNSSKQIHEVRNPKKTAKLHKIADRYDLDREMFQKVCEAQLRYWPLLK